MNVAVAIFRERVSPRLDIADTFLLYRLETGKWRRIENLHVINLLNDRPGQLLSLLQEKQVTTLICGGCPHFLMRMLTFQGIRVLPVLEVLPSQVEKELMAGNLENLPTCFPAKKCYGNKKRNQWCNTHKRR